MKLLLLIFSLSALFASCASQEPRPTNKENRSIDAWKSQVQFGAALDKESVEVGETLMLNITWTLSVKVDERPSAPTSPPEFKDFELLSENSHVSRGFFINDFLHWTYTYSYELAPQKVGNLNIGSAEIKINGETFKTEPLSILVSPEQYEETLKTNRCEKQHWSRYVLGEYFQTVADRSKLTPYDIVYGDSYARRNINAIEILLVNNNFLNYLTTMPEPIHKKFSRRFKSEEMQNQNRKVVFNTSIKRDYECYKKLK